MKLPMQEVVDQYFVKDDQFLSEIGKKFIKIRTKIQIDTIKIFLVERIVSEVHKVKKIKFHYEYNKYYTGSVEAKVYELAFINHENLDFDSVIDLMDGFKKFLIDKKFTKEDLKKKMDEQREFLLANQSLPKVIQVWLKLAD